MSNQTKHKVTWFKRDERGHWQWQGFRDELDTQEKVDAWLEEKQAEEGRAEQAGEQWDEVFIIDLENANEILINLMADSQTLADLNEYLEKVVDLDGITVEQTFSEWQDKKYAEDEDEE